MTWIILVLALSILIQIWHWINIFLPLTRPQQVSHINEQDHTPVSVIICFHQPWNAIPAVLEMLEKQSYSHFEVVLVNDGPVQLSLEHNRWIDDHPRIRYVEHNKTRSGKKEALAAGIHASRYDWLAFTDIDCYPGPEWLSQIVLHLPHEPSIMLGYSPYFPGSGWINFMVTQETILTAAQYMGWAERGKAYMGVGRNLIYHKSIYKAVTFQSHLHLPSGDDDLFINEAARWYPVQILTDPSSFVYSIPPGDWDSWRRQKTRHLSMGKFYSLTSKARISLFSFSLGFEKISLLWILFSGHFKLFFLFLILKYTFIVVPVVRIYRTFYSGAYFWKMWVYEWFHVLYLTLASPWIFIKTKKKWD